MNIRPNYNASPDPQLKKSDLYRKFRVPFQNITAKEFNAFGKYHKDAYISVAPHIEENIIDLLESSLDEIIPIKGYTGIGKTYLLLYTLKKYYNTNEINPNIAYLFDNKDEYNSQDLVMYCSHEDCTSSLLKNPIALLKSRIKVLAKTIDNHISNEDIEKYINKVRPEVEFYDEKNKTYYECVYSLVMLLHQKEIRNLVFIFDDIESLKEDEQFSIIKNFLALLGRC